MALRQRTSDCLNSINHISLCGKQGFMNVLRTLLSLRSAQITSESTWDAWQLDFIIQKAICNQSIADSRDGLYCATIEKWMNIYVMLWGSLTRYTYEMWRNSVVLALFMKYCISWKETDDNYSKIFVKLSHTALWWWACAHVTDSCQVMQHKQLLWEIFNNPEMFGSQYRNSQISILGEMHKSANCLLHFHHRQCTTWKTEKLLLNLNRNVYTELYGIF